MSVVTDKCVKNWVDNSVRNLRKADMKPMIQLTNGKQYLLVTRYGNCEALPVSKRVAEELIACGFSFGN